MNAARVAFSWYGLPHYAARQIREAIERLDERCVVIGSRPAVPVKGMGKGPPQPHVWIDPGIKVNWADLGLAPPKVFIQSGWSYPAIVALGRDARRHGARIIGMTDANVRGDFRQAVLGPVAFRLLHRSHFDAMIVAGAQGRRVMQMYGMPDANIREGFYGADPELFKAGPPLAQRGRTFLFVGRFEPVKNVLGLVDAFLRFNEQRPGWTLRLCGSGTQRTMIRDHPAIVVEDFVQPLDLPGRYPDARFFVLPSVREAWGLVVHEAALSGCALMLSDRVGSGDDLARPSNALRFRAGDTGALVAAFNEAADCGPEWLGGAERESLHLAAQFGPRRYADAVESLVTLCLEDAR